MSKINSLTNLGGFIDTVEYTPEYKEQCFLTWYSSGRPSASRLRAYIPKDEFKRTVSAGTLSDWMNSGKWRERADSMDVVVQEQVQKKAIAEKVKMLQRHAEMAFEMQNMGMEYIREQGIDSSAAAVRMIVEGVRIEHASRGMSDAIAKISQMDDDKLDITISQLLGRMSEKEREGLNDNEEDFVDVQSTEVEE